MMDQGQWDPSVIPMIAGWILLITAFIFAVEFIAQGTRRALNGDEEGYVDD